MSKWSKQDYEMVAECVRDTHETSECGGTSKELQTLANRFAKVFADDNPAFKRDLFLKACGVT